MPTINLGINRNNRRDYTKTKSMFQKVYQSMKWRRLRATKLRNNPLCEDCLLENRVTPTQEIHHIIPFYVDNEINLKLAYDYDNLVSLCIECHDKRHQKMKK